MLKYNHFSIFLLAVFLTSFIFGFSNVIAAPTIAITYPNGGEILNGTETITWTASDPANPQTFLADLYWGSIAGTKANHITNIDLISNCGFSTGTSWETSDLATTGLPDATFFDSIGVGFENFSFVNYNSIWLLNLYAHIGGGTSKRLTYKYSNSTAAWITASDYNSGLISCASIGGHGSETIFKMGSDLYALNYNCGATGLLQGFKFNGSVWIRDYDINNGLASANLDTMFSYQGISVFSYGGKNRLIGGIAAQNSTTNWAFDWNGSGWTQSADINANILAQLYNATSTDGQNFSQIGFFIRNNILYFIQIPVGNTPNFAGAFDSSIGQWNKDHDINVGLDSLNWGADRHYAGIDENNGNYFYFMRAEFHTTAGNGTNIQIKRLHKTSEIYVTSTAKNCSYSWDTTTATNGLTRFVDINATGTGTTIDSSNASFQILNYSASDMNVVCVENCVFSGFDGNSLVINPSDETKDIKFYVQNSETQKTAILDIKNSLKDGKRYFVWSSDADTNYSFNDSLTYGSATHIDGLQKLWNPTDEKYDYTFFDTFFGSETTYYWLKYQSPMKSWNSIVSVDWDNQLIPQTTDFNGTITNFFVVSSYANIGSETKQKIPDIFVSGRNYVFAFNADTNNAPQRIYAGYAAERGQTTATYVDAGIENHTYHFSGDDGYLSLRTNVSSTDIIGLSDYALMQRGYFMQDLVLSNSDGSPLPVMIDANVSYAYIREGQNFKVKTKLYDRDGSLKSIEIIVYLETIADANRVSYQYYDYSDLTSAETILDFEKIVAGITDFMPGTKSAKIIIRATDSDGYSEIRSEWIKFVQFPFYPNDFSISAIVLNKQLGKAPQITVNIRTVAPESLRGVRVYFSQETKAPNQSDYNATYFIPENFVCNGFDCSFTKIIDDWIWPKPGLWLFTASALLTTQNEDYNNILTAITIPVYINYKDFETLRVLETVERTTHEYRNDEEIQLVLQARTEDYRNIKNELAPYINLSNCDGSGSDKNCVIQDMNFAPISFLFDEKTGYNYWFWRNVFLNDNGTLLSDGNFYRVFARIVDKTQAYNVSAGLTALLAPKCQNYPADCNSVFCFVPNALASLNHFLFGCDVTTPAIVSNVLNADKEILLDINSAKSLTPPTLECVVCTNPDKNNVYANSLQQPVNCLAWYKLNEAPTDKWDISVGNQYSDFSKTGTAKQFLLASIPSEIIQMNDVGITRQALSSQYNTSIDTIGELVFYQLNSFIVPFLNTVKTIPTAAISSGLIQNAGFDCNFDRAISPNYLNGIVLFTIDGLQFYNLQDYVSQYKDLNAINPKDFKEYMAYKGRLLPEKKTFVSAYINDGEKIYSIETESPLVINVLPQNATLNKQNSDENTPFETAPVELKFNFIADLFYSNETGVIRRYVPLTFQAIISLTGFKGISALIQQLLENPLPIIFQNAWWMLGLLIVILIISLIYANFQKPGGNTINVLRR